MIFIFTTNEEEAEETDELSDDSATLADDLLDEVGGDEVVEGDDEIEGFGIIPDKEEEDDEDEEEEEDLDEDAELEEDAEDVDYDKFDDIDEM